MVKGKGSKGKGKGGGKSEGSDKWGRVRVREYIKQCKQTAKAKARGKEVKVKGLRQMQNVRIVDKRDISKPIFRIPENH